VYQALQAGYQADRQQPEPARPVTAGNRRVNRTLVRELMTTYLDSADLIQICFDLGEDYEDIVGQNDTKRDMVVAILLYFDRRDRLEELVDKCAAVRPQFEWWSAPG
jgi:hypothetical protein